MKNKKQKAIENLPNITTQVEYVDKDIKYNTPIQIKYEERLYKINTNNYFDKIEATWKCEYYRRLKDKPKTKTRFCDATIKGIREILNDKFKFYLKVDHSEICKEKFKEELNLGKKGDNSEDESQNKNEIIENSERPASENNNDNKKNNEEALINSFENNYKNCKDSKELDELIFKECLKNKAFLNNLSTFKKQFKNYYSKKKFIIKPYHLEYIYKKFNTLSNNLNLDNLFEYCNSNDIIGLFCRDISINYIFDSKKKIFKHEHIIFFLEESIKRLIVSEYILIDGTFVFPENYKQTLIIMYYDNILKKMIPSIFIVTNKKIYEGYLLIFNFIKRYITSYIKNELIHINWISFTTDFEIALINAFKKTFEIIPNLKHNGCFFHYMKNIYKYLLKNKYTVKSNKSHYNYIIKSVYELPFKLNIEKNIDKEI